MKKRIVTIALVAALLATCFAGTYAYLMADDAAKHTMTVGNVAIEQIELQRADGVDYKNGGEKADEGDLVAFEQNQKLFPSTYTTLSDYTAKGPNDEQFWWGDYVTADVTGDGSSNGLWDDKLTGAIDKFVFVQNTGSWDCYYRTIIAFECPVGTEYSEGYNKEFMMNVNLNSRFAWEEIGYITINNTRYLVMVATYQQPLKAGEISRPSLLQVVMTHNATNDTVLAIGDSYDILTLSQAAQTEGFDSAEHALNTAFGELNDTNVIKWLTPVAQAQAGPVA